MKRYSIVLVYVLTICFTAFNCKDSGEYYPVKTENVSTKTEITHKVIAKEFVNAGYTYVRVSENEKDYWIAIQNTKIDIGKTYYFEGGLKKSDFTSKELNKTFEEILFVDAIRSHENNTSEVELIPTPKNGITIKDLLKNEKEHANKEVIVKGKVVKVNRNILDRNWVHIKDGTTFNDKTQLTITTKDSVGLDDVVTFKGVVSLGKDFGYGYIYPVLIENGELIY